MQGRGKKRRRRRRGLRREGTEKKVISRTRNAGVNPCFLSVGSGRQSAVSRKGKEDERGEEGVEREVLAIIIIDIS